MTIMKEVEGQCALRAFVSFVFIKYAWCGCVGYHILMLQLYMSTGLHLSPYYVFVVLM